VKAISRAGLFAAFGLLAIAQYSFGATVYTADLLGANEVPPTASPATGSATLTLNGDSLDVEITFSGLVAPATAAHIHCCTPPGTNTIVALPFTGFPNTTSGTYSNLFDLTLDGTYTAAFETGSGGTAADAEAALVAGLNAGQAYVNIHDAIFPGGEIRGFAHLETPEPSSLFLGAIGLLGFVLLRRVFAS
jgi:hypothetical protein